MLYLHNQALLGPWELVKLGTSSASGWRTAPTNLARISSCHASGEGGSTPPMGSPEHGSPKRRAKSSKVTTISPRGNGSCASRGATSPGVRIPAGSRTQSATCAPLGAKRPA
jgi:hypothetical protein